MSTEILKRERIGGVFVVTLCRPHVRNAVDGFLDAAAVAAFEEFERRPDLNVAIITGAGGTFCSGMDLKAFAESGPPRAHPRGFLGLTQHRYNKPIIAAVEGHARAGGFEAALACDMIVASRDARFGLSEVTRGLAALGGGLFHLPRRIPQNVAMEMALTGEPIDAVRGHALGLVNRLAEPGEALAAAMQLAATIAANAPVAVSAAKAIITLQQDWLLDDMVERQEAIAGHLLASEDAREGALAFAQKRKPNWRGR